MDLSFMCTSGIGEVKCQVSGELPIELQLDGGVVNQSSLKVYSKALDYLMRGVTNFASGRILGTSINIGHLGSVVKNGSMVQWGLKVPKSEVVTYTVTSDNIKESMYFADAILNSGNSIKPIENKGLFKIKGEQLKANLVKGVVSVGESKLPYYYSYEGDDLVLKVKATDKVIDIEDVVEDDVYIALKLLSLFMSKSQHLGLVLLDCRGFSDAVIEFIVSMHKLFQKEYGVNLLFLYNLSPNSSIKTDKIYLPDIERK